MLTNRLQKFFPLFVRQSGEQLRVRTTIVDHHSSWISASVRNSQDVTYQTYVSSQLDGIHLACSCPYFAGADYCKHLWASLLVAEEQELLRQFRSSEQLQIIPQKNRFPVHDHGPPTPTIHVPTEPNWYDAFVSEKDPRPSKDLQKFAEHNDAQIVYVLDATQRFADGLHLEVNYVYPKKDGELSQPTRLSLGGEDLTFLSDPIDRQILANLVETRHTNAEVHTHHEFWLGPYVSASFLAQLFSSHRVFIKRYERSPKLIQPVVYRSLKNDSQHVWNLELRIDVRDDGFAMGGQLLQKKRKLLIVEITALTSSGYFFANDHLFRFSPAHHRWLQTLISEPDLFVKKSDKTRLLQALYGHHIPLRKVPNELHIPVHEPKPLPILTIRGQSPNAWLASLAFTYDTLSVDPDAPELALFHPDMSAGIRRNLSAENAAAQKLMQLGFARNRSSRSSWTLSSHQQFPNLALQLLNAGWSVRNSAKPYVPLRDSSFKIVSGVDWFELRGNVSFGNLSVPFPRLLEALRNGKNVVELDGGALGVLPQEWANRYAKLLTQGEVNGEQLRFSKNSFMTLETAVSDLPHIKVDAAFARLRKKLHTFSGIKSQRPTLNFCGKLRPYQRFSLGWFAYLREMNFGGCLADDMGLGKTVQVLALLAERQHATDKTAAKAPAPSLIVVPTSLLHNWKEEAQKFAPTLTLVEFTGSDRYQQTASWNKFNLVLTTYGILRRDKDVLATTHFDYVILDEAQAIKNRDSETASAARALHGTHRLALSGTPVENHIGELWSLLEFLNPRIFTPAFIEAHTRSAKDYSATARLVKPFIMRRTKEQVTPELPRKQEQILYCDLGVEQRELYDELKAHYRANLLKKIADFGFKKATIEILAGLLRLRQAACHPALVNPDHSNTPSTKLELLLPRLQQLHEEKHRALIFSQFTSFLQILREQMQRAGLPFLYLDGKSKNRQELVKSFQNKGDHPFFLISLKAGGVGLNLTAADYVFLLDPWWNPTAEAQAIDRAHRIGQKNPVFAYRLIAKNTVEEKILELQQKKKDLTRGVLESDEKFVRHINQHDLEFLLT